MRAARLGDASIKTTMRIRHRLGLLATLSGTLALCVAAAGWTLRAAHNPAEGAVLAWLGRMGAVRQPAARVATLSQAGWFSVNDVNAIVWLLAAAVLLAVAAMGLAVAAEWRRESTLWLACGYVCGALALALLKPVAGFVALTGGVMLAVLLRQERAQVNGQGNGQESG